LKREPTTAARSLRAVGLAITLVSIVTFSTFAYSAVADFQSFLGSLQSGSGPAITGSATLQGSTLLLDLNVTAQNQGLYPLSITLACSSDQSQGATCNNANMTILPGQTSTIVLLMSVPNATQYTTDGKQLHINGSATLVLEPFASVNVGEDWGSFFRPGGG
jgi:hypothetical protein